MTPIETIKEIKRVALTMTRVRAGLSHIVRLCADAEKEAGVYEQARVAVKRQVVVGGRRAFSKWLFESRRYSEDFLNVSSPETAVGLRAIDNADLERKLILLDDYDARSVNYLLIRGFEI